MTVFLETLPPHPPFPGFPTYGLKTYFTPPTLFSFSHIYVYRTPRQIFLDDPISLPQAEPSSLYLFSLLFVREMTLFFSVFFSAPLSISRQILAFSPSSPKNYSKVGDRELWFKKGFLIISLINIWIFFGFLDLISPLNFPRSLFPIFLHFAIDFMLRLS